MTGRLFTGCGFAACVLALAGCQVIGGASGSTGSVDDTTHLAVSNDVTDGQRVVYVLADVSCDMNTSEDRANRERALLVGANAAALDHGKLEVGVVRALASQNVNWHQSDFSLLDQSASTARFRVQDALTQRDSVVKKLRKDVNKSQGTVNGCASDLVSALSAVTLKQQELGASAARTDLVFVTNGLIVDRRTNIILTKNSLVSPGSYSRVLNAMLKKYPRPDLHSVHVWLVGTGWSPGIRNDQTGARVRELWTAYLKKAGATVVIQRNASDLPGLLGE